MRSFRCPEYRQSQEPSWLHLANYTIGKRSARRNQTSQTALTISAITHALTQAGKVPAGARHVRTHQTHKRHKSEPVNEYKCLSSPYSAAGCAAYLESPPSHHHNFIAHRLMGIRQPILFTCSSTGANTINIYSLSSAVTRHYCRIYYFLPETRQRLRSKKRFTNSFDLYRWAVTGIPPRGLKCISENFEDQCDACTTSQTGRASEEPKSKHLRCAAREMGKFEFSGFYET